MSISLILNNLVAATWQDNLLGDLKEPLSWIFIIAALLGSVYSIYLGFLLAKAPDPGRRDKAKRRIFFFMSGVFIIMFLYFLLIGANFPGSTGTTNPKPPGTDIPPPK